MPVRRKVFRIEQMGPIGTPAGAFGSATAHQQKEIVAELKALRELMERRPGAPADTAETRMSDVVDEANSIRQALQQTQEDIAALHASAFCSEGASRTTRELKAVATNVEQATQRVLDAAESIDEAAKNLAASVKLQTNQSMALDIQDQVLRIFEACNFQDLTGQRIAKVLATLQCIERRVVHMTELWGGLDSLKAEARETERRERRAALHGPKIEDNRDHASQSDVDVIFAAG